MSSPLVSIVVPSYRHKNYILNCLSSFLRQGYENMELIVIDDASADGSKQIIEDFLMENENFFVRTVFIEHDKNLGLIATLREATEIARGEYFVLLASDDALLDNTVPKQVAIMESNRNLGAISGNVFAIDDTGTKLPKYRQRTLRSADITFEQMWIGCDFSAAGAMIRASSFREVGGYAGNIIYEDWYLWLKLLDGGYSLHRNADHYAYYRHHSQNMHKNVEMMERGKRMVVQAFSYRADFDRLLEAYDKGQRSYSLSIAARSDKVSYLKSIILDRSTKIRPRDVLALLFVW